jgi:lipoprotein-anchoring transpeptidase ErfK/SrfK
MQRSVITALLGSALASVPAFGQQLVPYQQAAAQSYYGGQAAPPPPPAYAPPPRRDLGGGFIEFIFTGQSARPRQPQPAEPMQAAMQPVYVPAQMPAQPMIQASLPPPRAAMDPRFMRQTVAYDGDEKPGTVIINTPERLLYLVEENGTAVRYGIGVGRPGFTWSGVHQVSAKREWPDWYPPDEMLKRRPELPHFMEGGPNNPLGARALYLGSTLYRIHGSNEPWTIGQQVSSGCIRMRNEDVVDLYERVKVGTKVVVI